jgi:hypothetical protein
MCVERFRVMESCAASTLWIAQCMEGKNRRSVLKFVGYFELPWWRRCHPLDSRNNAIGLCLKSACTTANGWKERVESATLWPARSSNLKEQREANLEVECKSQVEAKISSTTLNMNKRDLKVNGMTSNRREVRWMTSNRLEVNGMTSKPWTLWQLDAEV